MAVSLLQCSTIKYSGGDTNYVSIPVHEEINRFNNHLSMRIGKRLNRCSELINIERRHLGRIENDDFALDADHWMKTGDLWIQIVARQLERDNDTGFQMAQKIRLNVENERRGRVSGSIDIKLCHALAPGPDRRYGNTAPFNLAVVGFDSLGILTQPSIALRLAER